MKTRAITGFFFVAVMLASVLLGSYAFTGFFLLLSILCLSEFFSLVKDENVRPNRFLGFLLAITLFAALAGYFLIKSPLIYISAALPVIFVIIISELYRGSNHPFHNISYTLFGVFFAAVPFCFFHATAFIEGSYEHYYPLGMLILLWGSDTGAYLFGISLGKHKLFERHSPKKTWEGFAGGLLTSLLAAGILSIYFPELALIHWLAVSAIIVVAGSYGDLTESMLKRSLSIKDSGSLLPGHGGLLDRFDGLLLAAPLVFVYLQFIRLF